MGSLTGSMLVVPGRSRSGPGRSQPRPTPPRPAPCSRRSPCPPRRSVLRAAGVATANAISAVAAVSDEHGGLVPRQVRWRRDGARRIVHGDRWWWGHAVELDLAHVRGERSDHLVDRDDASDLGGAMDREQEEIEITGYDADGNPIYGDRQIEVGDDGQGGDQR